MEGEGAGTEMELTDRWWLILSGLVAAVIAVEAARWRLGRWWSRARMRRRAQRARAGEVAAEALLESQGFRIIARQPQRQWSLTVDGEPRTVDMRADLLAERRGLTYVAEVKTGTVAPRLDTAATRRQLLEYRLAYGVQGVLLVDMSEGTIHEVVFPLDDSAGSPGSVRRALFWLLLGAALGGSIIWSYFE
jgi:Holliday junction resolvase-like predicted endonuclease